eukprot:m.115736 g.115736  ORF g.115736 m.115736 type:complete len:141 (+) comp37561_c0_seq2:103-525(+)
MVLLRKLVSQIIDEFLANEKASFSPSLPSWRRPDIRGLLDFMAEHLEWPWSYTQQKGFELLSYFAITRKDSTLRPERILRSRKMKGKACFELQWQGREAVKVPDSRLDEADGGERPHLVTTENADVCVYFAHVIHLKEGL